MRLSRALIVLTSAGCHLEGDAHCGVDGRIIAHWGAVRAAPPRPV